MSLRATAGRRLLPACRELDGNRDSCINLSTVAPAANIRTRYAPPIFSRLVSMPPVTPRHLAAVLDPS